MAVMVANEFIMAWLETLKVWLLANDLECSKLCI